MYALLNVVVMDEHNHAVPVGHFIVSNEQEPTFKVAMAALRSQAERACPEFAPSNFTIDDCAALANAIEAAWRDKYPGRPVPVHLCNWHVLRSWLKNLITKVKNPQQRVKMFEELRDIMYGAAADRLRDADELEAFVDQQEEDYCTRYQHQQPAFVAYFRQQWQQRVGSWVVALRNYPHDGQEGNQAIEGFHSALKRCFIRAALALTGRRLDWLIQLLIEDVEQEYRRRLVLQRHGFSINTHLEQQVRAAVSKAQTISYEDVAVHDNRIRVSVASMSRWGLAHEVLFPGTPYCTCTCEAGLQGKRCAHMARAMMALGNSAADVTKQLVHGKVGLAARKPGLFSSQQQATQPAQQQHGREAAVAPQQDGPYQPKGAPAYAQQPEQQQQQQQQPMEQDEPQDSADWCQQELYASASEPTPADDNGGITLPAPAITPPLQQGLGQPALLSSSTMRLQLDAQWDSSLSRQRSSTTGTTNWQHCCKQWLSKGLL